MVKIDKTHFIDEHGRRLMLRGINLDAKVPYEPDGSTHIKDGFYEKRKEVSFIGRPFPLAEADEHYRRLKHWGLTFFRFLVPWEALEHEGPGIYDEKYLDYLYEMVKKAGDYGHHLYIDVRQDVWSRFTGGDGAPAWTLEAVGFDITRFKESGAAITQQAYGSDYKPQIWNINGCRLAAATMFTLFFGGNDFAPKTKIEGQPAQEYLQGHLVKAYAKVAERLKGLPALVGYDTMNEPFRGYINCYNLNTTGWYHYKSGPCPTAFQGMLMGVGIPQEAEVWKPFLPKLIGSEVLNPGGVKVWKDGHDCIWRTHGVWDLDNEGKPVLLQPDYFQVRNGRQVDFVNDYHKGYINRFAAGIHAVDPSAWILLTPPSINFHPPAMGGSDAKNLVYKPHWYDDVHWVTKAFHFFPNAFVGNDKLTNKPVIGLPGKVQSSFNDQMRRIKEIGANVRGGVPTVIGEIGICYDMNNREAYRTGNYSAHIQEWDRLFKALDANMLNYNLWTYDPFNTNEHGDNWCLEDFSIFSRSQQTNPYDLNSGGRALEAVVRPYPVAVAGDPLRFSFDMKRRIFKFEFRHDPAVTEPTEIYVPTFQYPKGYKVTVSDGTYTIDRDNQRLIYRHDPIQSIHKIKVEPPA
jgi:hypothetical protein